MVAAAELKPLAGRALAIEALWPGPLAPLTRRITGQPKKRRFLMAAQTAKGSCTALLLIVSDNSLS